MEKKNKGDIYKAFANESRVQLLLCLSQTQSVTELLTHCTFSQSALSQHLKILKNAGIVVCERDGKQQIYKIINKKVLQIAKLLREFK